MLGILAEATPPPAQNNFGDTMSDGLAGPMALLIIVLLAIATVLLIRNMNGRLRRLPASFPPPGAQRDGGSARSGAAERGASAGPATGGGTDGSPDATVAPAAPGTPGGVPGSAGGPTE